MPDLSTSFDGFARPVGERPPSHRVKARSQLLEVWNEVRAHIGPETFAPVLGTVAPGRRSSRTDGTWVRTNGEHDHNFVNMTIEIDSEELSLNVVGWYDSQLKKMEAWLRQPRAWRLLDQMPDWFLIIFIRHANVGKDGKPVFQGAKGVEFERLDFAATNAANISTRLNGIRPKLDSATEKLSLHIRRRWTVAECTAIDDIAATVAPEVERWLQPIQQLRLA